MIIRPTPEQRAEMAAYVEEQEPGLLAELGISSLDWANCGTIANYRQHYRLGQPPCAACRRAHAEYQRQRRLRAK